MPVGRTRRWTRRAAEPRQNDSLANLGAKPFFVLPGEGGADPKLPTAPQSRGRAGGGARISDTKRLGQPVLTAVPMGTLSVRIERIIRDRQWAKVSRTEKVRPD
jgi:hypothetical protein